MKGNKNPTYKHNKEADTKIKNTQINIENHKQEYDEKDTQTRTYFLGQEYAYD